MIDRSIVASIELHLLYNELLTLSQLSILNFTGFLQVEGLELKVGQPFL